MKTKQATLITYGVRISAILTFLMGIINLISAIRPAIQPRLATIESFIPLAVRNGSRLAIALAGFGLLMLSINLWRRKRVAWILTLVLLGISLASHFFKGLDFEEMAFALILATLLLVLNKSFYAQSDQASIKQGLITLLAALGFTVLYGTLGFFFLDRHFKMPYVFWDAVRQTVMMFTYFSDPGLEPVTAHGHFFVRSIYVIGFSTLGFAALMLLRPVLLRQTATAAEREHARDIVEHYGHTALARATLFSDKAYFFGPGDTVIAYAVGGRVALSLGDPIGPADQIPEAIQGFLEYCARRDWMPAFISTLPDHLPAYHQSGLESICIGYEAIVNLAGLSLEGSQNKDVRNAVNRMQRNGFQSKIFLPPLDDDLIGSLRSISDAWLRQRNLRELHYSDGWFEDDYIRSSPVITVFDDLNKAVAFANLVGEYQKNELTLDLMRHIPDTAHGTMEFLFYRMMEWAKGQGYATFSLGLSAIAGVGDKPQDSQVERALHTISEYITRFIDFQGLHTFKDKFHPDWQPRYMIFPGNSSILSVVTALIEVHSGSKNLFELVRK